MNWEKLTSFELEQARETTSGVCLLPMGVLEKHGDALPLGQDALYAHALCTAAAEIEPAMVFPHYYFGQIAESRHQPGSIAIVPELQLSLLESVCDEISRNGFHKILIVNGHGGNTVMIGTFLNTLLAREKDYFVFSLFADAMDQLREHFDSRNDGHGGEYEVSQMYAVHPELVKNGGMPGDYGQPLHRMKSFTDLGAASPVNWYSNFPGQLDGDPIPGTQEKGKIAFEYERDQVVKLLRLIKKDDTPERLYREFHARARNPHYVKA